MIRISIIIPTYNRIDSLRLALRSLVEQDFPVEEFEILVVDNGCTDATHAIVDEAIQNNRGYNIRYIVEPVPGLLSGRHRGASEAKGSLLVFIDDDIEADRHWLNSIGDAFMNPAVHLVGGKCLPNYETPPPAWTEQIWKRTSDGDACSYYSLIDYGDQRREIDANLVWGLNFSIRRDTLYRLGGFHPDAVPRSYQRYQGDGETGLTIKLKAQGLKVIYEPGALVYHQIPAERLTVRYLEQRQYYQGVCDSYTSIRGTEHFDFIHNACLFPATEREMLAYRMGAAYISGYNYHQSMVKKDPRLLEWVMRENYFDYRYPEPQ